MAHPRNRNQSHRSLVSDPSYSAFPSFSERTQDVSSHADASTFSDGSHNLRRSLNVAQNLSRLADVQSSPYGPNPVPSPRTRAWLQLSADASLDPQSDSTVYVSNSDSAASTRSSNIAHTREQLRVQRRRPENSYTVTRAGAVLSFSESESESESEDEQMTLGRIDMDENEYSDDHESYGGESLVDSAYQATFDDVTFSRAQTHSNYLTAAGNIVRVRALTAQGVRQSDHIQSHQYQQQQQPDPQTARHLHSQQISRRLRLPRLPQGTSPPIWTLQRSHPEIVSRPQSLLYQRHPQEQPLHSENYRALHPQLLQAQPQEQSMSAEAAGAMDGQQPRPAFLSQPVYQLACAACIRPLCVRAMKAVMLSDHSKELYSTDMPPAGLQLVNEDRQVRHCACRIRDSACLGCGQVAGYHVTQPCSDCLDDQNNGHFWMFYSSAVYHYKRNRIGGPTGDVMLWANVPTISYDQALSRQLRLEVPALSIRTTPMRSSAGADAVDTAASSGDRPMTACVKMDEWLNSPAVEVICR